MIMNSHNIHSKDLKVFYTEEKNIFVIFQVVSYFR